MAVCWNCASQVPDGARFCPNCAHSQGDRRTSPLFVVDSTTGLFNRDFLKALADQESNRAHRYHRPLALLVCQVDHAGYINQDLGPQLLSQLLRELGEVLVAAVRDTDTVCFIEGEGPPRFGVVLPETDYEGALNAADKIRRAVAAHEFEASAHWNHLTVSCGAATVNHERMGREDLLAVAGGALEHGLEAGPNRTHAVSPL